MTKQFEDVARESPRASKVLVALFSALIAFVVLSLGWQQWVYSQQRTDMREMAIRWEGMVKALTDRQDVLRTQLYEIKDANNKQDVLIARGADQVERYVCDLKELKKVMESGFDKMGTKIEAIELRRSGR